MYTNSTRIIHKGNVKDGFTITTKFNVFFAAEKGIFGNLMIRLQWKHTCVFLGYRLKEYWQGVGIVDNTSFVCLYKTSWGDYE